MVRGISGGGRYDHLVKLISGGKVDLPGLGFGMGDVVLTELLKDRDLLPKAAQGPDAFVIIEDESLRSECLRLIQQLREAGIVIDYGLTAAKSDKQFKRAQEQKAHFTVKLERDSDGSLHARIKNLVSRSEERFAATESNELIGRLRGASAIPSNE